MSPFRSAAATGAVALLGIGALAGCGSEPAEPAGPDSACGEAVASVGVDLEGLSAEDVLYDEGKPGFSSVVVYRDGRVAVVGIEQDAWERPFQTSSTSADGGGRTGAARVAAVAVPATVTSPVITAVPAMMWAPHPESPRLLVGQLPDCALEDLEALADDLSGVLTTTRGDLGDPQITDMPTTWIDYRGSSPVTVGAYALTAEFDQGLTDAQRQGRELMRAMIAAITWNLPEVHEEDPTVFARWGEDGCQAITDPAEVAEVLTAYDNRDEGDRNNYPDAPYEARAVPPGVGPCP